MAAPAPNSVAALAANNPFGGGDRGDHNTPGSCLDDPNFATICSFIEKFGEIVRIGHVPFDELQQMLENNVDVPLPLVQLHITLLRRVFKAVTPDKWERSLAKFGHTYCSQDAWEIERFGYKKAKISLKLRLLKNLLEAQFDYNVKFKSEVNKLQAADLRLTPLGRDTEGQVYWYQVDADANLRVYREDIDDETWEMVASSKDELVDLISQLQRGEVKKPEPEEAIIVPEEDSNGKDIEPKEIILDTGKVEEDGSMGEESEESDDDSDEAEVKPEVKTVEPLVIKQTSTGNECVKKSDQSKTTESDNVPNVKQEVLHKNVTCENMGKGNIGLKLVFGVKSKPKQELTDSIETTPFTPPAAFSTVKQEDHHHEEPSKTSQVVKAKVETLEKDLTTESLKEREPEVKSEDNVLVKDSVTSKITDISSSSSNSSSISKTILKKPTKEEKESKLQLLLQSNREMSTSKPIRHEVSAFVSEVVKKSKKIESFVQPPKEAKTLDSKPTLSSTTEVVTDSTASTKAIEPISIHLDEQLQDTQPLDLQSKSGKDKQTENKHTNREARTDLKDPIITQVKVQAKTTNVKKEVKTDFIGSLVIQNPQQSNNQRPANITATIVEDHQTESEPMDIDTSTDNADTVNIASVSPDKVPVPSTMMQTEKMEVLRKPDVSSTKSFENFSPKADISVEKVVTIPCMTVQKDVQKEVNLSAKAQDQEKMKEVVSDLTPCRISKVDATPPSISETRCISSNVSKDNAASSTSVSTDSASLSAERECDSISKRVSEESTNVSIVCKQNVVSSKAIEDLSLSNESKESDTSTLVSTKNANLSFESKDKPLSPSPCKESKESVTSSDPVDSTPVVVEEPLTKKETWVCGDDKLLPVDEKVTKETAWVCGNAEPIESKKLPVEKESQEEGLTTASQHTQELKKCESDVSSEDIQAIQSKSSLVFYSESSEGSDVGDDDEADTSSKKEVRDGSTKEHKEDSTNANNKSKKLGIDSKNDLIPLTTEPLGIQEKTNQKEKPKPDELSDNKKKNSSENVNPIAGDFAKNDLKDGNTIIVSDDHVNTDLKKKSDPITQQNSEASTKVVQVSVSDNSKDVVKPDDKSIKEASLDLSMSADQRTDNTEPAVDLCIVKLSTTADSISKEGDANAETKPPNLNASETAMPPSSFPASVSNEPNRDESSGKRKPEEELESASKAPRLDVTKSLDIVEPVVAAAPFNPIVGETIEEEVMTIIGEGAGALNEGSNENSPASLVADMAGSNDESDESEESREAFPSRGRGGRRGRGRRGRPVGVGGGRRSSQSSKTPRSANKGMREVARLGVAADSLEVNGDRENERPVRASRRIAQIRLKEEEERRKLEEERLAQLKAAQLQKKAKQASTKDHTKESVGSQKSPVPKIKKGNGRKPLKDQLKFHGKDYVPSGTDSEDNSEEGDASDDYDGTGKSSKRKKRRKNGKAPKKGGNPWATSSDDDEEEAVEEEEEYHYEEEEEELVFKSDHEFSPESDLGEDDGVGPSRHARTAKQDKGDKLFEEGNCCKCGKGDHPEWILLCDKCDKGWHASCLRPQLWVIPEGEWFCPPCQHNMLIENLSKNLVEYEVLLKRRENEILRKQRLAYVGISLDNVLPDKEQPEKVEAEEIEKHSHDRERHRKQRRRILSDEDDDELSDFINDRSDDNISRSRTNSSADSEDEPVYRLRARRSKKAFNFKEYDDMINSALRGDEDEEEEVEEEKGDEVEEEQDEGAQVNGDKKEAVSGGKNDAFLKHLEEQAHEEEETDEELLDEKERIRRKELKKSCHRKTKRRINDLDAYSDEDSDDDFQASEAEDDEEEELGEDGESEWSGERMEEDSDDSIAKRARRKDRHGRLGRREKYSDKGLVRRSTRKRKSRISYDESDEDEEEEDQTDKWQSGESEESESNSESDDSTWGKRKKKAAAPPKSKVPNFMLEASSNSKGKGKGGVKRKKRKADDDDVDRAWNSARGRKQKEEPIERRTRGRKINFKDILDSGESDDEGNVRPKRRPLSDSDDSRSPSSSRKLAEEIRAENARQAKEYEERQAKKVEGTGVVVEDSESSMTAPPALSETLTAPKLLESNIQNNTVPSPKLASSPSQLPVVPSASPIGSPMVSSPASLPPSSSPLIAAPISSPLPINPVSSPILLSTAPSPVPKLVTSNLSSISSAVPFVPTTQSIPPPPPSVLLPKSPPPLTFPSTVGALNLLLTTPPKPVFPLSQPVPVPPPVVSERKSKSKSSRGSRGSSKSDKHSSSDLEPKPVKAPPLPPALAKSLSKKKDSSSITVPNVNLLLAGGVLPEILSQGGIGIPSVLRSVVPAPVSSSSGSSSKKGSNANNSALNQPHGKTSSTSSSSRPPNSSPPPPPISQNLSPSMPIDIDRVPNPALFQGNPGIRPFHPMWVRNPGPPLPPYTTAGSPVLGKPPPLNTSSFTGQPGPPTRPGYPSPPPLRIPNPNTSPLQAFQHFKRDSPISGPLYRLQTGQPQPGGPLPNILPPGMMSPHSGGPERFFGAPPYGHPYGLLPPHTQGQHPQPIFGSPYDYRPPEPPFKEEPAPPPRNSSGSLPTPVSSASSSPPPTSSTVPSTTKDEASAARDSEFGGLVSYFSSQRSEEDMDT